MSLGLNNKDDVILDKLYDYIYGGKKLDMKENDLVKLYEYLNRWSILKWETGWINQKYKYWLKIYRKSL